MTKLLGPNVVRKVLYHDRYLLEDIQQKYSLVYASDKIKPRSKNCPYDEIEDDLSQEGSSFLDINTITTILSFF